MNIDDIIHPKGKKKKRNGSSNNLQGYGNTFPMDFGNTTLPPLRPPPIGSNPGPPPPPQFPQYPELNPPRPSPKRTQSSSSNTGMNMGVGMNMGGYPPLGQFPSPFPPPPSGAPPPNPGPPPRRPRDPHMNLQGIPLFPSPGDPAPPGSGLNFGIPQPRGMPTCAICGAPFQSKSHHDQHMQLFHAQKSPANSKKKKTKKYPCPMCPNVYEAPSRLYAHYQAVHEKAKPHRCPICQKGFAYKGDLEVHIRGVHQKIKDHKCILCGAQFTRAYHLRRHMKQVHENGPQNPSHSRGTEKKRRPSGSHSDYNSKRGRR